MLPFPQNGENTEAMEAPAACPASAAARRLCDAGQQTSPQNELERGNTP